MQPKISIQLCKWRSVFWASRLGIDSIESWIAIATVPACQTAGIQVKTIAGDRISTAKAIEFLPLNKSLAVTDDRTNSFPNPFPRATRPNPAAASLFPWLSEFGCLTRVLTFMRSTCTQKSRVGERKRGGENLTMFGFRSSITTKICKMSRTWATFFHLSQSQKRFAPKRIPKIYCHRQTDPL